MKLKAWQNGMGFDFGAWELVKMADGNWSAAEKPRWFGGLAKVGTGRTYIEAMKNAKVTDEFREFIALQQAAA